MDSNAAIHHEYSLAVPPLRKSVSSAFQAQIRNLVPLAGLLAILFVLHLLIPGTVPTGAEPGRWLALAEEMRGSDVMSADVTHPPLFPALIAMMLTFGVPPIAALLAAALFAKASLVAAVYLTGLTLNRFYATVAAALVAMAAAQMELYAQGGYAQLMGMAFGLLAVFMVVRYLDTQERRHLWYGLALGAAALASNLLIAVLLPVAIGVAIAIWLLLIAPKRSTWARGVRTGGAIAGLTAVVLLALFFLWARSGGGPALDPSALSRWDALLHVSRDASWLWAILLVAAVVVLPLRRWPAHIAATLAVAASWLATSGVVFLVAGVQSSLLISQMSVTILAAIGFGAAQQQLVGAERRRHSSKRPRPVSHRMLLLVGVSVLNALVVVGFAAHLSAADQHRLVDHGELSALDRLRAESGPGDLAVAARGKGGMPVGWWVEGYAQLPTYTGHEPRLLAFAEERDEANVANDIFSGALSDAEIMATLRDIGADYLVVDRRGPDSAFLDRDLARGMRVVDDTSNVVILDARTNE